MTTATVITNKCMVCKETSKMDVDLDAYVAWQQNGTLVQDAFPTMSTDDREQLITGTHPECWSIMFDHYEEG